MGAPPTPARQSPSRLTSAVDILALGLAFTVVFNLLFHQYFPNDRGRLGHDYSYFLPHLLAGDFWIQRNGIFAVPWFTPAFCGGVPMFANPQSPYYTVTQFLSALFVDPLTAVYLTLLLFAWMGYAGFYLLLRGPFASGRAVAILGAVLFMFNGLYAHRMMVGHLTFHAFMLMPLLAFLLLRGPFVGAPGSRAAWLAGVAGASATIAYMVMAGMIQMILPVLLSVVVVAILAGGARGGGLRFALRFALSGLLAGAVCLARLTASAAFLEPFPRDDYKLPGAGSVLGAMQLAVESLFFRPAHKAAADGILLNQEWSLDQHEFEFGVTVVPLLALLVGGGVALVRWRRAGFGRPGWRRVLQAVAVALILLLPIVLNCYTPAWNATLKGLPLLRSSSSLIRWFCLYIPVVILGAALAIEGLTSSALAKWLAAAAGVATCLVTNLVADDSFYQQQGYDPAAITKAYHQSDIPDIRTIGDRTAGGNDALVRGTSPGMCYEPIFGYRLEHLPFKTLTPGPVVDQHAGTLNIKNPACYLFPRENHCAPGDHFSVRDKDDAAAFARYRAFAFEMPLRQRLANVVSLLAALGVVALLLRGPVGRLVGRRAGMKGG